MGVISDFGFTIGGWNYNAIYPCIFYATPNKNVSRMCETFLLFI